MKTLRMGETPNLPDTFRCPICGDRLTLAIDEWTEYGNAWIASETGIHATCVSEPEADEDLDDWLNGHYQMPYVDWLPVDQKVYEWLKANYRFVEVR